jgi:hypothetical protein
LVSSTVMVVVAREVLAVSWVPAVQALAWWSL